MDSNIYERFIIKESGILEERPRTIISCDLGKKQDPTCVAIIEQRGMGSKSRYDVRNIARYPLGTGYTSITRELAEIAAAPELREAKALDLVFDATGIGQVVGDSLLLAGIKARIHGINITAGNEVKYQGYYINVPKVELVGCLQLVLDQNRIQFAEALPELEPLRYEIQAFDTKITDAGNVTFGAAEGSHDDMVIALALGVWYGANRQEWAVNGFFV